MRALFVAALAVWFVAQAAASEMPKVCANPTPEELKDTETQELCRELRRLNATADALERQVLNFKQEITTLQDAADRVSRVFSLDSVPDQYDSMRRKIPSSPLEVTHSR